MALGAEEIYGVYRRPQQSQAVDLIGRATDRGIGTRQWLAEEQLNNTRELGRSFERGLDRFGEERQRAHQRGVDEQQQAREGQRFGMEQERFGLDKENMARQGKLTDAQLTEANMRNRMLGTEEALGDELVDDGNGGKVSRRAQLANLDVAGKKKSMEATDAQIAASRAQTGMAQSAAQLSQQQFEDARNATAKQQLTTELNAVAGQIQAAQDELAQAQATGNAASYKAAQDKLAQAQTDASALTSQAKAKYKLTDADVASALRTAQGGAARSANEAGVIYSTTREGAGYGDQKENITAKLKAYSDLNNEAKKYISQNTTQSPEAQTSLANMKAIMSDRLGKVGEAERLRSGVSFTGDVPQWAGGSGSFTRGDELVKKAVQDVRADIERDIADLKARHSGPTVPAVVKKEISQLEALKREIDGRNGYIEKDTLNVLRNRQPPPPGMQQAGGFPQSTSALRALARTPVIPPTTTTTGTPRP